MLSVCLLRNSLFSSEYLLRSLYLRHYNSAFINLNATMQKVLSADESKVLFHALHANLH